MNKFLVQFIDAGKIVEQHTRNTQAEAEDVAYVTIRAGVYHKAIVYEYLGVEGEATRCVLELDHQTVCPEEYDTPVDPRADFDGDWNGHAW